MIRNEEGNGTIPADSPSPVLRMRRSGEAAGGESRFFPGRSMIRVGEESSEENPASFSMSVDLGRSGDRIRRGLDGSSFPVNAACPSLRIRTPPRSPSGSTRSDGFWPGLTVGVVFVKRRRPIDPISSDRKATRLTLGSWSWSFRTTVKARELLG